MRPLRTGLREMGQLTNRGRTGRRDGSAGKGAGCASLSDALSSVPGAKVKMDGECCLRKAVL